MQPSPAASLQKKIGYWAALSLIVGSIIGSGVFMKPASMAEILGSPLLLSLVWIIAGVFSLFGALIFAELGAMMPETGGIYVYFKKIFGNFFAYMYGWSAFAVTNTAAVAAISFICAEYAGAIFNLPRFDPDTELSFFFHIPYIGVIYPLENFGVKALAILLVVSLTYLNYRTVKGGNILQVISTFVKVAVIVALVLGIFFSGKGEINNFYTSDNDESFATMVNAIIMAMTGAFFAYDGWINATYVAGEIKDPKKALPRSLIAGVFICIAVYLLVNQAYLYVMNIDQVAGSKLVAADAISIAWGTEGSILISALVVLTTFGAINGNILSTARVTYAMGKDDLFFRWTGKEHKKFNSPGNALWLHAIWTILFIITGSFNMLADMFVFISWIMYGIAAVGVMILRKRMKDVERPYRMWGYPVVPILFILFSGFYLVFTIYNDINNYLNDRQPVVNSLLGMMICLLGVPLYFYFKWKYKKLPVSGVLQTSEEPKDPNVI